MRKLFMLLLCLLLLPGFPAHAQKTPEYVDAYVHDPSIIKADDGYFYIFGSHMAAARSLDLLKWEMLSTDAGAGCTLVENVQEEMGEALAWAKTSTFWAPDVQQLADGRYYMYYCTCEGSSPLSALGLAVSDKPEGPYEDLGIFLKSGMAGQSEDGTPYDATVHPNVIDAHVFYDNDGKLWMVYGSYSGGIFILEMDENTGFPLPGQGYGKKLLGKNHSRIEGPYILYAPDTEYYYLFLSFGGLNAADGYNIRVARSKNPDGPYEDALGQDMLDCGGPDGSFFDDGAIEGYGVKLMGGFRFLPLENEEAIPEAAYKSPGHNSAYYDAETGRYFLIFHTRFSALGEQHNVRVHEFWFNEQGWPIVAPTRYSGETDTAAPADEILGEYRVIAHDRDINKAQHKSVLVQLEENDFVAGDFVGSWRVEDGALTITLSGLTYTGVFRHGYDAQQQAWTTTLTALSADGAALWGTRTKN